jgi:methylenetetrahydrofolate reductase (NADPH)
MSTLLSMLRQPRYEVLPARSAEQAVADHIPAGSTVAVTASAAKGLDATLDLAERLAARGYRVVPHLAARSVRDETHLKEIVRRLTAAGVDDVFVPGGDSKEPAGCFDGALPLLERLTQMSNPFRYVGITGYPESVPHISDDVTIQSMWDKRRHATYIVSNVCFNPTALRAWIARIRARGVTLPLYAGLSGPAERARLLRLAAVSGATESVRFLARHPAWALRLGLPGGYHPGRFCERVGEFGPGDGVVGVHLFTFNQIKHIEEWRRSAL